MKYKGMIIDRLNSIATKTTKAYDTYQAAHEAAEKANKIGERGQIAVKKIATAEEYAALFDCTENEIDALVEVVRKNVPAGKASHFYGADNDAVVCVLSNAKNDGIDLI